MAKIKMFTIDSSYLPKKTIISNCECVNIKEKEKMSVEKQA